MSAGDVKQQIAAACGVREKHLRLAPGRLHLGGTEVQCHGIRLSPDRNNTRVQRARNLPGRQAGGYASPCLALLGGRTTVTVHGAWPATSEETPPSSER